MRSATVVLFYALVATVHSQWEVPVPIVLTGPTSADRQVTGLADPLTTDAATSLAAVRGLAVSFTQVSGASAMVGTLTPAPAQYTPGMVVTIVPTEGHDAGATLNLNGLGPVPVHKVPGQPIDSAELAVGMPARLLYDGEAFVVVSHTPRPCPMGYSMVGRGFCIEDSSHADTTFFAANRACHQAGARLCSMGEWSLACLTLPGFFDTVPVGEWVDSAANDADKAKVVGYGSLGYGSNPNGSGCEYGGYSVPTGSRRYRCCIRR